MKTNLKARTKCFLILKYDYIKYYINSPLKIIIERSQKVIGLPALQAPFRHLFPPFKMTLYSSHMMNEECSARIKGFGGGEGDSFKL